MYASMKDELEKVALPAAALGAALGAGAGALGGAARAEPGSRLKGALLGGAGGAALGGAAGAGAGALGRRMSAPVAGIPRVNASPRGLPMTARGTQVMPSTLTPTQGAAGARRPSGGTQAMPSTASAGPVTKASPVSASQQATIGAPPGSLPSGVMPEIPGGSGTQRMGTPSDYYTPPAKNPTLYAHNIAAKGWRELPPNVQAAMQNSDLVRLGVPPELAAQLAAKSARPGEDTVSSIARHAVGGGGTASRARRVSPAAATLAKAASALGVGQLQAMRQAIEEDVEIPSQLKNIERIRSYVQSLKEKKAYATSEFSGYMGPGRFVNYASHIPPFVNPPVKTAGPPSEEQEKKTKTSAMLDELAKLNAIQSPEAQITKSQKVGAPKAAGPPGPSIQQIAKPVGYGRPISGAAKSIQGL